MSKPWQLTKLGDVLEPAAREEIVDAAKEYRLLGVRLDGNGPFIREKVLGSQISAIKLFRVETGDFIYSRLFAGRGAFGVIGAELDGCYVSGEFPTFLPVQGKVDVHFLKFWFKLPPVIRLVDENCSGSTPLTRNRFKEQYFLALEIPLPSISEQRRVVARIEELNAQIHEARYLRNQITEDVDSLGISHHMQLAGNRKCRLGEIISLDEDVVPILPEDLYPQVGVKSFGAGLFSKPAISGTETRYRHFNRLFEGAIVLSQVKGWEGAIAVCPSNLAGYFVSPEYRTFRCIQNEARSVYMAAIVRTKWFWSRLSDATRGVGARRERTRPEQFVNVELPMPDYQSQIFGELTLTKLYELKRLQAETAAELDAMLPAILNRAFKGELC
ncbi:MAG: restriction endonuclease subunit S [Ignavibacteria bacterium]|nr:restriction endonuclease subunit S [Ignavibacteria bacterium]